MANQSVPTTVIIAAVGALLAIIGVFLPWLSGGNFSQTINGTNASFFSGNAIIVLAIIGLLGLVSIYTLRDRTAILGAVILATALGLITVFMAIGNYSDVKNVLTQSGGDASPGIGIYVVLVGAIVQTAFSGFYLLQVVQGSQPMSQPGDET